MTNGTLQVMNDSISRLNRLTGTYADDLEAIISNIRWISTLILAEMAGLAGYRQLTEEGGLSVPFALVVVMLAASLVCLVWAAIVARNERRNLSLKLHRFISDCNSIARNTGIAQDMQIAQIQDQEDGVYAAISDPSESSKFLEAVGLSLFAFASVVAGLFVLIGEIMQALFDLLASVFAAALG